MSEVPILKETTRSTGRDALRNNITAAMALAGAVRTTLGPLGQDKLLIDDEGRTLVTNDGVTVLESAKVEHPVARMLINASTTQDRIARDGTTSAVLLSAELLQNAWELVLQGVHPSAIARGYRLAEEASRKHFETLVIDATPEHQLQAASTSLSGKIHEAMQHHLATLAVQAAEAVVEQRSAGIVADPTRVKILTQTGGAMTDSSLVTGLVLAKKRATDAMPKQIGSGKIALVDGGLERRELMSNVKLNVSTPGVLEQFRQQEKTLLNEQVQHLVDLGVTLFACKEGIDDDMHAVLAQAGIQAYRRVARADLDLLARGTNATLNNDVRSLTSGDLGVFINSKNERWNGVMHWIVETEEGGATFIAKGSTNETVGEVERCFADALGVACQLLEEPKLLPGGGATQVALARHLRRFAEGFLVANNLPLMRSQMPWKSFLVRLRKTLGSTRSTHSCKLLLPKTKRTTPATLSAWMQRKRHQRTWLNKASLNPYESLGKPLPALRRLHFPCYELMMCCGPNKTPLHRNFPRKTEMKGSAWIQATSSYMEWKWKFYG